MTPDDLTDAEKRVRDALSHPRKLAAMAKVTRSEWEWRRAAEVLLRMTTRQRASATALSRAQSSPVAR